MDTTQNQSVALVLEKDDAEEDLFGGDADLKPAPRMDRAISFAPDPAELTQQEKEQEKVAPIKPVEPISLFG